MLGSPLPFSSPLTLLRPPFPALPTVGELLTLLSRHFNVLLKRPASYRVHYTSHGPFLESKTSPRGDTHTSYKHRQDAPFKPTWYILSYSATVPNHLNLRLPLVHQPSTYVPCTLLAYLSLRGWPDLSSASGRGGGRSVAASLPRYATANHLAVPLLAGSHHALNLASKNPSISHFSAHSDLLSTLPLRIWSSLLLSHSLALALARQAQ